MDGDKPLFDLAQLNFDEFVSFFFDHDIDVEEFWYHDPAFITLGIFDDEDTSSPAIVVDYMSRLFTTFVETLARFSLQQIDTGIWAMLGPDPFVLHKHLWLPTVPLLERTACIRSMYRVYSDFVSKSQVKVMETCFYMWWDLVATGFWDYLRFTEKIQAGDITHLNQEHRILLDTLFETLSKILALPDEGSQGAALHGLGHLHHLGVRDLVQTFIQQNRNRMSEEEIRWVEQCRDGTVM